MAQKIIINGWHSLFVLKRHSPRDRRAIGLAAIGLGIFTSVLAANLLRLNQQFAGPTIKVIGSVEALYPSGPWLRTRYHLVPNNPRVAYCYPIGTVEMRTVAPVGEEVFDKLSVGDLLPVRYLPKNPTINRIDLPAVNAERQRAPSLMTAMSILFICGGACLFIKARQDIKTGKTHQTPRNRDFVPDLDNRKELRTRGWSSEDFSKILTDFQKLHDDDLGNDIATKIHSSNDGTLRITFPQDVPDQLFPYLINYAQYPKGFKPKTGSILVVGKAVLSENFEGIPSPKLIGQEAVFYVPSDDRKYDVVYVQVGKETFSNSFASNRWKKVTDPRLPADFANLSSTPRITA
jgi:hypothetical protein